MTVLNASPAPAAVQTPASSYFNTLNALLLNMAVTTAAGHPVDLDTGTAQAVQAILDVRQRHSKVMIVGNGGSATIASHIHTDLMHGVGMCALVFYDQGLLTARANDVGYNTAFEYAQNLWAQPGDLVIAISSSGQSENIVRSARLGRERDCFVITLSGFKAENPLRQHGHLNFYVPSMAYGYVEMAHAVLSHCITDQVVASVKK